MLVRTTERLDLRWFSVDDAPFVLALMNDPSWIEFIGDRGVRTLDDARRYIDDRLLAPCRSLGFGLWLVERRADRVPIGMCGLIRRDSLPDVDIGFAFLPEFGGRGYTTEAANATLEHGYRVFGLKRIIAITSPENARSARVLRRIGMRLEERARLAGEDHDVLVFAIDIEASAARASDDKAQIDAIARRFFAGFTNKTGTQPAVAELARLFASGAIVVKAVGTQPEIMDVRQFIAPREALLTDGRLVEFEEIEVHERTEIYGNVAQRWSAYRKSGILNGEAFEGGGQKSLQLVKTAEGWKISALAWDDEREGA